jgi:hypothetical protein
MISDDGGGKENKYKPIGTKTGLDVTPQNKKIANRPTVRN